MFLFKKIIFVSIHEFNANLISFSQFFTFNKFSEFGMGIFFISLSFLSEELSPNKFLYA